MPKTIVPEVKSVLNGHSLPKGQAQADGRTSGAQMGSGNDDLVRLDYSGGFSSGRELDGSVKKAVLDGFGEVFGADVVATH